MLKLGITIEVVKVKMPSVSGDSLLKARYLALLEAL